MIVGKVPIMPVMVDKSMDSVPNATTSNVWPRLEATRFEPRPDGDLEVVAKGSQTVEALTDPLTSGTKESLARAVKHEVVNHYGVALGSVLITENERGEHPIRDDRWVGPSQIMDIDQKAKGMISREMSDVLALTRGERVYNSAVDLEALDPRLEHLSVEGQKQVKKNLHREITWDHSEDLMANNLDRDKVKEMLRPIINKEIQDQAQRTLELRAQAAPQQGGRARPLGQPAQVQPPQVQPQPQPAAAPWAVVSPQVQPAAAPLIGGYRTAPQVPAQAGQVQPPGGPPADSGG
jgi:hypothetical protein